MDELAFATASELAAAIRNRRLSSREAVAAALGRVERYNRPLNAIITVDGDRALALADDADATFARGDEVGPLHGVPITIKDCFETAGLRTTSGFPVLQDYVPDRDASSVARLRQAGAIIIGKTNMPPLAAGNVSDNPLFGRSSNPWDLTRTPGGSTGGGAAAVAAGMSPLELGSDYSGSLREPAHYSGVVTIRPTEHRVPATGHIPPLPGGATSTRHMNTVGPVARSLDDLELALGIIAGPDGVEWEVPPVPLGRAPARPLNSLRLAFCVAFPGLPVEPVIADALRRFANALEQAGATVEEATPDGFDAIDAIETYGELAASERGAGVSAEQEALDLANLGVSLDHAEPDRRGRARRQNTTLRDYTTTLLHRDRLIAALDAFLGRFEAFLCPVAMTPAFTHRPNRAPVAVNGVEIGGWTASFGYTAPFAVTGNPVLVMPIAWEPWDGADVLPVGVQLVGRRWCEPELFAVARALEQLTGGVQRPPGYD
ncbi:MAG TPA: amidase family protein [Tepidiformaceae bacterium]|nr:amidase family protein [Tepidiformaceae bacterium]